jgi:hypothetical protein
MLDSIAMMDVPIDDLDPGNPQKSPGCSNCGIIQEAKPHPVHGSGMVPGRPHDCKGGPPGKSFPGGHDGCPGSTTGGIP